MLKQIVEKTKYLSLVAPVLAQESIPLKPKEGTTWTNLTGITAPSLVSGLISLVMLIAALVFFFMLLWGGIKWVTSEGDEKKVATARAQITNALVGLAIVFAAWAILWLINVIFGINILDLAVPSVQP
ncbi:MAG: pilin [Patescibacteria group bacterium]|jgi:hypothetical protein